MFSDVYSGIAAGEIDKLAIGRHGYAAYDLMTKAGIGAFTEVARRFSESGSMLVLCGSGNNGGDGYVVARCALQEGWQVSLLATGEPRSADAQAARTEYLESGGVISEATDSVMQSDYTVVVDALLGIGLSGPARGIYADWINMANNIDGFKLALDVPSGVDADTGNVFLPAFRADLTISFIVAKLGLLTGPGRSHSGQVDLHDLDIPHTIINQVEKSATILARPLISARIKDSHKGHFGSIVIAGGDNGMLGAVLLAGRAALRCGAGKATILSTDEHLDKPALHTPELMSAVYEECAVEDLQQAGVIALGPGLGTSTWGEQVFQALVKIERPLLIDADGLNLLSRTNLASGSGNWVLTPHPGEAALLLATSTKAVQADRLTAVRRIAAQRNAVCVLKGAGTLIADPQGRVTLCMAGNPGMASAGMGDVLSGMIASLMGQGFGPRNAAETAVWLHSYSADVVVANNSEASLIASDVIDQLPQTMASLSSK